MLKYTGHPFIDVGIAAITSFVNKRQPEEVTAEDLEKVVTYIESNYVRPPLRGTLTMAFTSNAWFIQDAYNPDKPGISMEERTTRQATRADWSARHLRQWQVAPSASERCVFTGDPAIATKLSGKLRDSRAGRAQMPLLQGDDAINFFTYGDPGLPISGIALLALQFFPMGCAKAGVGLLAVHSDNDHLTYALARGFLTRNIEAVGKAQIAGEDKLPSAERSLKTLLIEALLDAERRRSKFEGTEQPGSVTAYNFNNGKKPSLQLYHLPLEIVSFIRIVNTPTYEAAWKQLVQRGWQRTGFKKGKQDESLQEPRRNFLYEDLFDLPANAVRFIRRYFLRVPRQTPFEDDPRRNYSLLKDMKLISWPLVELFLRKVVLMDASMIAGIREFGDRLADYIERTGDKKFFRGLRVAKDYGQFRLLLIYKLERAAKNGVLLINYDEYVGIFEDANETIPGGWRLARDLVLIRIIDQLYHRNKIADVADELEDELELTEE